jgi:mannobiose 2-epimerase
MPYVPDFKSEMKKELQNILEYWMEHVVEKNGEGFYGRVDGNNKPDLSSPKSIVVTSRILWTFSAAHLLFPDKRYPLMAKKAYDYLKKYFVDPVNGGVYWLVKADGSPEVTKKQLYGHAFAVYGLSEYYKISKDAEVLNLARSVFNTFIKHGYDKEQGGYIEGFDSDWKNTDDYILSKGEDRKSMNTHLHLLECFTNYYQVAKDETSKFHLKHSLEMMLDHIIDPATYRMRLFFKEDWTPTTPVISYGHDIEASWLLYEAAEFLGDKKLLARSKEVSLQMAKAAIDGLAPDGAINYEYDPVTKHLQDRKDWWPQAEAMVGFYNAYQLSGKVGYLEKAEKVWAFIKDHLIDYKNGEWFGGVTADYKVAGTDKANIWKGPYHNGRACMEMYKRAGGKH